LVWQRLVAGEYEIVASLTADLVDRLPPRRRDLAFLASCGSGRAGLDLPGESLGLPNSLLAAGFRGVVATLWPVGDRVAFVTLSRLLQAFRNQPEEAPARVVQQVRRWLRTASPADLAVWFEQLQAEVGLPEPVVAGMSEWLARFGPKARPFGDEADWAAFAYIGR
jgi:CHAT domain-containing protein